MKEENQDFKINKNGDLEIFPSPNSSHNDFDFYVGKWKIKNKKLKVKKKYKKDS